MKRETPRGGKYPEASQAAKNGSAGFGFGGGKARGRRRQKEASTTTVENTKKLKKAKAGRPGEVFGWL